VRGISISLTITSVQLESLFCKVREDADCQTEGQEVTSKVRESVVRVRHEQTRKRVELKTPYG
jgi:hypothetical protein